MRRSLPQPLRNARVMRRVVIMACATLLAWLAHGSAAALYWRANPDGRVPAAWREDPTIVVLRSGTVANAAPSDSGPPVAPANLAAARKAVRSEPLQASALRLLAQGTPGEAGPLYHLSEQVSRRELRTQAVLLTTALEARRYREAVRHLDVLVSINPAATSELVRSAVPLLAYPEFQQALRPFREKAWVKALVRTAIQSPGYIAYGADLIERLPLDLGQDDSGIQPLLLTRYAERLNFASARALAMSFGHVTAAELDAFALAGAAIDPRLAPLAWTTRNDDAVRGSFDLDGGLDVVLQPGRLAAVLERTTTLAPGRHRFGFSLAADPSAPTAGLRWRVRCAADPAMRVIWEQPVPMDGAERRYAATLDTTGCTAQRWQLLAVAPDGQVPSHFGLSGLTLDTLP